MYLSLTPRQIGLQTVSRLLAAPESAGPSPRAMIVTPLPATVLLPQLRTALVKQLSAAPNGLQHLQARVRNCLEKISIARVFDIDGLWEVLAELEGAASAAALRQDDGMAAVSRERQKTEIQDSEDEDGLSAPESPDAEPAPGGSPLPDIILVTHTSTLINALFTARDKQAAHDTMLRLSSRLYHFTRSPALSGPLVMLLNSTNASVSPHPADYPGAAVPDSITPSKQPDPTLRSIFVYPPGPPHAGARAAGRYGLPAQAQRRSKPAYGLVFSQMLDLHLLCTRVPRTRAAAAAAAASAAARDVSYVWVVEVLLDEVGVYERSGSGEELVVSRRSREQRWACVDVEEGRVVDAVIG